MEFPIGKIEPDEGLQTGCPLNPILSVAVTENTISVPEGLFVCVDIFSVITNGSVISSSVNSTIIVNSPNPWFPVLSVAVQLTVEFPIGKIEPDEGLQTTVGDSSKLSVTEICIGPS